MFGLGSKDEDNRARAVEIPAFLTKPGRVNHVEEPVTGVTADGSLVTGQRNEGVTTPGTDGFAGVDAILDEGMTAMRDEIVVQNDPLSNQHASVIAGMIATFEGKEADVVRQINVLQTDLAEIRKTLDGYRQAHAVFVAPTILPAPQE